MAFIPPRPPGPNPAQMAAQRAAMQAQQAVQRAAAQAQQAARNAGAGAYMAAQQARRAGATPGPAGSPAVNAPMTAGIGRPSAAGAALRIALGSLLILLVFYALIVYGVDRSVASPQMRGSMFMFVAAVVALLAGYRVTSGTGRLWAAVFCGLLIGIELALLDFLSFMVLFHASTSSPFSYYFASIAIGNIRLQAVRVVSALVGGCGAKIASLARGRHV